MIFFFFFLMKKTIVLSCVKSYDGQTKWMYFLTEDDDLLEKYNTIWDKVSTDFIKDFASEPVYNKNILKIKTKSHYNELKHFYNKKIPKAVRFF